MNASHQLDIDFTTIPNDASSFEKLVEDLLQEMGYGATRTGLGPDGGADIIAERFSTDPVFGRENKRFVVQCKHFAHSNAAVGVGQVTSVIDTMTAKNAHGYLLVTSTELTSGLVSKLSELQSRTGNYTVAFWDAGILRKQLLEHLPVVFRHFPIQSSQLLKSFHRPIGRAQGLCFELVQEQIKTYVGPKFVPALYIARGLDLNFKAYLEAPMNHLRESSRIVKNAITQMAATGNGSPPIPKCVHSNISKRVAFVITVSVAEILTALRSVSGKLSVLDVDYVKLYLEGGINGLLQANSHLLSSLNGIREELMAAFSPLLVTLSFLRSEEERIATRLRGNGSMLAQNQLEREQVRAKRTELLKAIRRNKRNLGRDSELKCEIKKCDKALSAIGTSRRRLHNQQAANARQLKKWENRRDFSKMCVRRANIPPGSEGLSIIAALEGLHAFLDGAVQTECLEQLPYSGMLSKSVHVIIDVAGSGKTNFCCKLALASCTGHFVLFLTGKGLTRDKIPIEDWINATIRRVYPNRGEYAIGENIKWLYSSGYPLLVIIDGINEVSQYELMQATLISLSQLSAGLPMRTVLSSRQEYWPFFEPCVRHQEYCDPIQNPLSNFSDDEHLMAIPRYLHHYKLKTRIESVAWEQLRRPLLLRFFCEAYGDPMNVNYRSLPAIREVRLNQLFDEYCKIKFKNIGETLRAQGASIDLEEVRTFVWIVAGRLLKKRAKALMVTEAIRIQPLNLKFSRSIYEALLAEDIVIEEQARVENGKKVNRRLAFVYEAFEEYVMAHVIWENRKAYPKGLPEFIRDMFSAQQKYASIWGICTYLLALCYKGDKESADMILVHMGMATSPQVVFQTLLNMWKADFRSGIWPLLRVCANNVLVMPIEDIRRFLQDWLSENEAEELLSCIVDEPKVITVIYGDRAPEMLLKIGEKSVNIQAAIHSITEWAWPGLIENLFIGLSNKARFDNCNFTYTDIVAIAKRVRGPMTTPKDWKSYGAWFNGVEHFAAVVINSCPVTGFNKYEMESVVADVARLYVSACELRSHVKHYAVIKLAGIFGIKIRSSQNKVA